ncbi:hypothetical protein V6Z12_D11G195200 [Gossypium hirsutum]
MFDLVILDFSWIRLLFGGYLNCSTVSIRVFTLNAKIVVWLSIFQVHHDKHYREIQGGRSHFKKTKDSRRDLIVERFHRCTPSMSLIFTGSPKGPISASQTTATRIKPLY